MSTTRSWLLGSCLCLICLGAYLANGRIMSPGGDDVPNRLIPFSLLGWGTLTLEPFRGNLTAQPVRWYWRERQGTIVSFYPIGTAAVALPVYLPCYLLLRARGRDTPSELFQVSAVVEKLAAAVIAALAVAVLFAILRQRLSAPNATANALAFGLGTGMWALSSQLLWQHGPGVLCILLGLWSLVRPRHPGASVAAGFFLGLASAVRPQNAVFLVAGAVYLWLAGEDRARKVHSVLWLALGSLLPLAATLAYNFHYYGNFLGGYRELTVNFQPAILDGVLGLLLSPNRGLLVFSPVVILGFWGMAQALRRWRTEPLLASFCGAAVLFLFIHASTKTWDGGGSFGPRYLTETLPVLALAASLTVPKLAPWGRVGALILVAWSVLVELDGVICYPASMWHARMAPLSARRSSWDFRHVMLLEDFQTWLARRNPPPPEAARAGPPPAALLPDSAFKVEWQAATVPRTMKATERVVARITFRNIGDRAWPDPAAVDPARSGAYAVRLRFRWRRGAWAGPYSAPSDLREPLEPRQATTVLIPVIAPAAPDTYDLQFELEQERVTWFAEKGAPRLSIQVRVTSGDTLRPVERSRGSRESNAGSPPRPAGATARQSLHSSVRALVPTGSSR
ncbi:MAG TPA: hypothetical protein VHQ90_11095 [Thermoanaerobaculia bacterium]|nr:hypothetical protein [Thermoanaerobaculia bacterium]